MTPERDDDDDEPSPDDLLSLNIGGHTGTMVSRRTMTQFQDSLLASHFSGRWKLPKDKDGNVFIDEDPNLFLALISFLRSVSKQAPHSSLPAISNLSCEMERLLEHYNLTFRMYPVELDIFKHADEDGQESLSRTRRSAPRFEPPCR